MDNSAASVLLIVLFSSLHLAISNASDKTTTHTCPAKCTVAGVTRSSLSRLEHDCPSTDRFVKCSISLWLVSDGTLTVMFDGDSSAQAINESLTPSSFDRFFYHHTQVNFYANKSELNVNVRNACFNQDDCSRIFAQKMADQLLGYQFIQLQEKIRPLIYDPLANTEIQFFTTDLRCSIGHGGGNEIPCNTTCYIFSSSAIEQRSCWLGSLVGLHVYTEHDLPAPRNTSITFSYNCNTREPLCNGPDVLANVTHIVNNFFYDPPYNPKSIACSTYIVNHFVFLTILASFHYSLLHFA